MNKADPDDARNDEEYKINVGEAHVYVRGTTGGADYGRLKSGLPQTGSPGITAEAGTIFTVNGSAVEVENTDGIASVSYTHLDVYKRQVLKRLSAP